MQGAGPCTTDPNPNGGIRPEGDCPAGGNVYIGVRYSVSYWIRSAEVWHALSMDFAISLLPVENGEVKV